MLVRCLRHRTRQAENVERKTGAGLHESPKNGQEPHDNEPRAEAVQKRVLAEARRGRSHQKPGKSHLLRIRAHHRQVLLLRNLQRRYS